MSDTSFFHSFGGRRSSTPFLGKDVQLFICKFRNFLCLFRGDFLQKFFFLRTIFADFFFFADNFCKYFFVILLRTNSFFMNFLAENFCGFFLYE
ncbi:unnamed protein product [Meloidogyne enterolobii]|uniref:Uncharacterized protein n=1 Tax=Meloidogyne enterolobii TaxID=390850 RepID=A0ACB0Y521_MELEN